MTDGGDRQRDRDTLARLGARLKRARETSRIVPRPRMGAGGPTTGLGLALRIGVEMVAGVAVGAGMGYALDRWLGTSPWLLIAFFFLGAAAGGLNTWRAISGSDFGLAAPRRAAPDDNGERGEREG